MSPNITRTHQEHVVFEDMRPLEGVRELIREKDYVNQEESQSSMNNEVAEEIEESEIRNLYALRVAIL